MDHAYSSNEVIRIIRDALLARSDNSISFQDLLETNKAFGSEKAGIGRPIIIDKSRRRTDTAITRRTVGISHHLYNCLMANTLLYIINMTFAGPWRFQWSVHVCPTAYHSHGIL